MHTGRSFTQCRLRLLMITAHKAAKASLHSSIAAAATDR